MSFSSYVVVDTNTSAPNFKAVTRYNFHYYLKCHHTCELERHLHTRELEHHLIPLEKVSPQFCPKKFSSSNPDLEVRLINPSRGEEKRGQALNHTPSLVRTLGILADPRFLLACDIIQYDTRPTLGHLGTYDLMIYINDANKLATKLTQYSPHLEDMSSDEMFISLLQLDEFEIRILQTGVQAMQRFESGFYG
jgi:hypothetical protein